MTPYTFEAMGTTWALVVDRPELLSAAEGLVRDAEARLSRFRPTSALSALNRARRATDPLLADVVRRALAARAVTAGAFDPTLGVALASHGYDRSLEQVDRPAARPRDARPDVVVDGDTVHLQGEGDVDLGGIGKGYAVDLVARWLAALGVTRALVDGGGDLRALGGPWAVGVGDDDAVLITDEAVATSSICRRRWVTADGAVAHHLLDPATGRPVDATLDTATVRAPDATTADVLATAVLVDPDHVVPRLAALGARALVRDRAGAWWSTPDWEVCP